MAATTAMDERRGPPDDAMAIHSLQCTLENKTKNFSKGVKDAKRNPMEERHFPSTLSGLRAAQRTAVAERDFIASIAELRSQELPTVLQNMRIALSPGGQIVALRQNQKDAVSACYGGQGYDTDWLRFGSGVMHFFTQSGETIPVTLEPGTVVPLGLAVEPQQPVEDEAALTLLVEVCCVDIGVARAALPGF